MSVFVSWRGCDREVKNELVAHLRTALPGEEIWESDEGCKSNAYEEFIQKIRQSEIFIVIVSDEAMQPSYVFNEVIEARKCEMDGTLNMLMFKITDSPLTPTFAANLNHISDANHVGRLNGTEEGYATLAARVKYLLEKRRIGEPENSYETFTPEIVGTDVGGGYFVEHSRDDVFGQIDEAFACSNVVIASQISGYGRRCAVREYARQRKAAYAHTVFVHFCGGSLREFFTQGLRFTNIPDEIFDKLSENDVILRKAKILQKLGKDTLLIVPEVTPDERDDRFVLDALATVGCRIVFVTQYAAALRRVFPVVSVDRLQDEHLKELFFYYYEAYPDEQEELSEVLTDFFDSIDGHTRSVEITAKVLADAFGVYPQDVPDILKNIHPNSSNELSERIFDLISDLFDLSKFSETERGILLAAAYFARIPMDEKQLVKMLQAGGCYDAKALRSLIEHGWLTNDRATRTVCVDRFLAEVCLSKIVPDEELVAKFFEVINGACSVEMLEISMGAMFESWRRLQTFFKAVELPALIELVQKCSLYLDETTVDATGLAIEELCSRAKAEVDARFGDGALRTQLRGFVDTLSALLVGAALMQTPDADYRNVNVSQRMVSQLNTPEMLGLVDTAMKELPESPFKTALGGLVRALTTLNIGAFVGAYEQVVELVCRDGALQTLPEGVPDFLYIVGESVLFAVCAVPYLSLRASRAWMRLVQANGVYSYSRAYLIGYAYLQTLCSMGIADEEFEDTYGFTLRTLSKADEEEKFFKSAEKSYEAYSGLFCFGVRRFTESGGTEKAMELLEELAKVPPVNAELFDNFISAVSAVVERCVKDGDTESAREVLQGMSAYLEAAGEVEIQEETERTLAELENYCEALFTEQSDEDFGDGATEYLDYYRTYATEFSDKRLLKRYEELAQKAKALELSALSREELLDRVARLKERAARGARREALIPEAFALVSEAGFRTLGYRHHLVQYMGGAAIAEGKIAEIQNGEGKTYTIPLAAFLHYLYGEKVHIVDSSAYLTQRNFAWMRGVFEYLGCTVCVFFDGKTGLREDYSAYDIVYETARDLMFKTMYCERQRKAWLPRMDVAIVDEAEQLLIAEGSQNYTLVQDAAAQDHTALAQAVLHVVTDTVSIDPERYYSRDPISGSFRLKEEAYDALHAYCEENNVEIGSRHDLVETYLTWCILAFFHRERDRDYFVVDGRIKSENTAKGSFEDFSDYYTFFLCSKEGLPYPSARLIERRIDDAYVTMELMAGFRKLAGTTATAVSMQKELKTIYGLEVVPIPPNVKTRRVDHAPEVFLTGRDRDERLFALIAEKYEARQPVLVITESVYDSVAVSRVLRQREIPHELLNAQNADQGAEVLERAGLPGAVTVATALANRGVDIRLGGNAKAMAKEHLLRAGYSREAIDEAMAGLSGVDSEFLRRKLDDLTAIYRRDTEQARAELNGHSGLCVIGTSCFDDLRTEQQMRGRCGRQGDRGESYVFFSLEDDSLRRLFGNRLEAYQQMCNELGFEGDLGSNRFLNNAILQSRERLQHWAYRRLENLPEMMYRPQARQAVRDILTRLERSSDYADELVEQYFTASAPSIRDARMLAADELSGELRSRAHGSALLSIRPYFGERVATAKDKDMPKLLRAALEAYWAEQSPMSADKDILAQILKQNISPVWGEYIEEMLHEAAEAKALYPEARKLQKHLRQYSEELLCRLLEGAVSRAVRCRVLPNN